VYLPIVLMAREFYVDVLAVSGESAIVVPKVSFGESEEGISEEEAAARRELKERNEKRLVLFELVDEFIITGKTLKEGGAFR
jgi:hypothetical protein